MNADAAWSFLLGAVVGAPLFVLGVVLAMVGLRPS